MRAAGRGLVMAGPLPSHVPLERNNGVIGPKLAHGFRLLDGLAPAKLLPSSMTAWSWLRRFLSAGCPLRSGLLRAGCSLFSGPHLNAVQSNPPCQHPVCWQCAGGIAAGHLASSDVRLAQHEPPRQASVGGQRSAMREGGGWPARACRRGSGMRPMRGGRAAVMATAWLCPGAVAALGRRFYDRGNGLVTALASSVRPWMARPRDAVLRCRLWAGIRLMPG
jgi:hypothetical protein